ncbi:MAG TPA: ABC transporter permease subunit, partial [Acidimicrobiales bacterium]
MPEIVRQMWDYLSSGDAWSGSRGLPALTWAHLKLAGVAVLVAAAVAIPPAVFLGHVRRGGLLAISIVNIGRALPTFAILVLVLPFSLRWGFGLGFWPTVVALVLLGIPPIFTNTYTGIRDVSPDALEAARGMGMRGGQVVRQVEVPVAWPLIITGLRVSAVQVVATATLGPLVGYINLGT